jgi:hypothetical protein
LERIQLNSRDETVAALGFTLDSSIRVSGTTLLMRESACSVFADVTDEGDLYAAVLTMRGATRDDLRANERAETDLCCAASDILLEFCEDVDQGTCKETRGCSKADETPTAACALHKTAGK